MHVGCVEALNTNNLLPNIRVIYRDLDQFYEYVKRADGLELSEFKVQTNVIKKISIKDWISLYIPQTWQMDDSKIPEFDLAAFFQDLRICNFQQALLRQSVALKNPDNVGECFELLVASLLKALNPEQILYNLKCSEEGRNHIESDLLVWHKQQLFLIELKASPKESWSQVMRVLEQTGRKLGGLNAKSMLIAPRLNIEAYKEAPSLADAYKIKLVTELELNNLPEQIAQWLGLPQAPENLRVLFKQNSNFLKRALSAPPMRKHY